MADAFELTEREKRTLTLGLKRTETGALIQQALNVMREEAKDSLLSTDDVDQNVRTRERFRGAKEFVDRLFESCELTEEERAQGKGQEETYSHKGI